MLDLFAGSGALGIEALSRGAVRVTFVERDRAALSALQQNLKALAVEARTRVLAEDAVRAVERLERGGERFDVAFLDPPYGAPEAAGSLAALSRSALVGEGGVVVLEHASIDAPPAEPGLTILRTRAYGTVSLTLYAKPGSDGGAAS